GAKRKPFVTTIHRERLAVTDICYASLNNRKKILLALFDCVLWSLFVMLSFPRSEEVVMSVVINTSKGQGSTPARRVYSLAVIAVAAVALGGPAVAAAQDAASAPAASTSAASSPEATGASGANSEAQEMLYYVCGQAGFEKTVTSPDPKHPFNLGITFVAQQNGSPLSDVAVRLR